jgi:hypothetical protein
MRREQVVRQHLPVRKCQQRQPLAGEKLQLGRKALELASIVRYDDVQPLVRPRRFGERQRSRATVQLMPAEASKLRCGDLRLEEQSLVGFQRDLTHLQPSMQRHAIDVDGICPAAQDHGWQRESPDIQPVSVE